VDDELRDQVKRLRDRADIYDCMQRYARGIDRQDRALLRSAYHDGAADDHVGFVGAVNDFIDWALAYHSTQTRYQHYLLNHAVDIDGHPRPLACVACRHAAGSARRDLFSRGVTGQRVVCVVGRGADALGAK